MQVKNKNNDNSGNNFSFYMHDGARAFSFEIAGAISDCAALELEQAWKTASSAAAGQALIVDLSYVTRVDAAGRKILRRWFEQGAQFVAKLPQARAIVASITGQPFELVAESTQHRTWRPLHAFRGLAVTVLPAAVRVIAASLF